MGRVLRRIFWMETVLIVGKTGVGGCGIMGMLSWLTRFG